jgi:hypothetical protein
MRKWKTWKKIGEEWRTVFCFFAEDCDEARETAQTLHNLPPLVGDGYSKTAVATYVGNGILVKEVGA